MEAPTPFNAKLIASSQRLYRIYVRRSDLYFIVLAGGLSANPESLTVHFGLIGALIGHGLKKRAKKKNQALIQRIDQLDPQELLAEDKHNFKVHTAEIQEAAIDPPALFAFQGRQSGRWKLCLRSGKKMNFQFENNDDMKAALVLLPQFLDSTLKVNVEWNEKKKRFQKKKPASLS